ncbi:MAG: hypothetical protein RBR28_07010 [Lentimicrobium sp.]|nr:hypothetical protein [Lentimicrobium sp.]
MADFFHDDYRNEYQASLLLRYSLSVIHGLNNSCVASPVIGYICNT